MSIWYYQSMNWEAIGVIIAGVTIVGGILLFIAKSLISFGETKHQFKTMGERMDSNEDKHTKLNELITKIEVDVGFIRGCMSSQNIAPAANELSVSNSPRQLSDLGRKVLVDSSIGDILDTQYETILRNVKEMDPENSYQAQEYIIKVVNELIENDSIRNTVEEGAFLSGYTPRDVLFVGALNIRERVFSDLNFDVGEIDIHDPSIR